MATFAQDAAAGVYYRVTCNACRREAILTARAVCAAGQGDRESFGFQRSLRCAGCQMRGQAVVTLAGYWTGPWEHRPADWADTVEERARGPVVAAEPPELTPGPSGSGSGT